MRLEILLATLALAACDRGAPANQTSTVPDAMPSEEELARDAELANEAAADEAADMNNFGGSVADMSNGSETD